MNVKRFKIELVEPYLDALKRREISIEEVAKEVGRNYKSVKRTLNSMGSVVPLRMFIGTEEERRRLKKLCNDKHITKTEYERRVKELERRVPVEEEEAAEKQKEGLYICKGCNRNYQYSLFIEETGYCYECILRGKSRRGKLKFRGIF